jgi:hypothetical protein
VSLTHPHTFRRGETVSLRPRKGCTTMSYAKVIRHHSPHAVRVLITADSGGRRRGETYTAPLGCLAPRPHGQHRRRRPRPQEAGWWRR